MNKCIECCGSGWIGSYNDVVCYECNGKGYLLPKKKISYPHKKCIERSKKYCHCISDFVDEVKRRK